MHYLLLIFFFRRLGRRQLLLQGVQLAEVVLVQTHADGAVGQCVQGSLDAGDLGLDFGGGAVHLSAHGLVEVVQDGFQLLGLERHHEAGAPVGHVDLELHIGEGEVLVFDSLGDVEHRHEQADEVLILVLEGELGFPDFGVRREGLGTLALPDPASGFPAPPAGALSGGPNFNPADPAADAADLMSQPPSKRYLDDLQSFTTNEVAINWNAPLVWVAAFLDYTGK